MTKLTEVAYQTRRAINWAILFFIIYIILRIFWSLFVAVILLIFPPKAPPPNHKFGRLPAVAFPKTASPSGTLTFSLETIQGSIPQASASGTVYFMPKQAANLLALTKTQEFAKSLGLDPNPLQESKNVYRFGDDNFPLRRLRFDIVSSNFILRYAYEQDPGVFSEKALPSEDEAKMEAKNLLQKYALYTEDFQKGTTVVSFLRLNGNKLVPTTSLSQADAVRVDMFRRPVDGMNLFTPYPGEGQVAIIFSGSKQPQKRVIQFAYTYWPIEYDTSATYALKSSSEAWEELKNGRGYVARYPLNGTNVTVRNVYLAYYDSFDPQTYLQPIFVFEGDDGFLAYVPAVAPPWTE